MSFMGQLQDELAELKKEGVYKRLNYFDSPQAARVRMEGRGEVVILSSNNYLGLCDVPLNLANRIIFKGITVYGVIGRKLYETWHQMRRFLIGGQFDPRPVITHKFPLAQIDDALAAIRSGDAGKVILEIA